MNTEVLFSSESGEWSTPQDLFDKLNAEFHFTLDVCATAENAKCAHYFTKEQDGLAQPWTGVCWCNPPYGRGIGAWVKKARDASFDGATTVCLLPVRTDTKWWQAFIENEAGAFFADRVRFIAGRLRFGDAKNSAPFPSALVVYCSRQLALPGMP